MELLTARDVAKLLKISERKAYSLMERRELPIVKIGRLIRVTPEDLENFVQRNRIEVQWTYARRKA